MKNLRFPSSLASLALLTLAACGASNSGDKAPPNPPTRVTENCESIVFDIEEMRAQGLVLPFVFDGLVVQAGSWETSCESSRTVNGKTSEVSRRGFTKLLVSGGYSAAGSVQEEDPSLGSDGRLEIELENELVSDSRLQGLLERLRITSALPLESLFTVSAFRQLNLASIAVVEGLDLARASIETTLAQDNVTPVSFLKIWSPEPALFKQKLLTGKSLDVVSFAATNFQSQSLPQALGFTLRLNSEILKLRPLPHNTVLSKLWLDHARSDDAKLYALSLARTWIAGQKVLRDEFGAAGPRGLAEMRRFAENRWSSDPIKVSRLDLSSLELLQTLSLLNARQSFYVTWMAKLRGFFGNQDDRALEASMAWFRNSSGLNEPQRDFTLKLAEILRDKRQSDAWTAAQSFAPQLNYDESKLQLLEPVLAWVQSYSGPYLSGDASLRESFALMALPGFNASRLTELQTLFAWMQSYSGPYVTDKGMALTRCKSLLNEATWSAAFFESLQQTFAWLQSYSGPYETSKERAYSEARALVARTSWIEAGFSIAKDTFAWMQSYSGPYVSSKSDALVKTKKYADDAKWNLERLALMQESFAWLQSYSGPYISNKTNALQKAELYIFTRSMSREQFTRLQDAFTRESKNQTKEAALRKAEASVFGPGN
jgi:hypothetical protein